MITPMSGPASGDPWAEWLRRRRHGDDEVALEQTLAHLAPIRDAVLDNVDLKDGHTLLDVGCGDGLIAFGALERLGSRGKVIFSDVSSELLSGCRELARELGVLERCQFVEASADDLSTIETDSVDALTTRSVLLGSALREETCSAAENQGMDPDSISVDEVVLHECAHQPDAAVHKDVLTRLFLQLADFLGDVAFDEVGVVPRKWLLESV